MNKCTSLGEEIANSLTHGIGVIFALVAAILLFTKGVGFAIFSLSIILTYSFSTLYHSLYFTKARSIFQRLDHIAIFLLIAGTYTPFVLILRNNLGLLLLLFVWLVSIGGIIYKSVFGDKKQSLMVILYLLLSWSGILLIKPLQILFPTIVLALLIIGGFFYTFGTIFYGLRKLKYNHMIWHLFVFAGTLSHFLALELLAHD